jgi:thiol-disulfide isomerase/thioredoxin
MMTPKEERRIKKWNGELSSEIEILVLATDDGRSSQIADFCDHLARLAPKIHLVLEEDEHNGTPAIGIGSGLRYHAVPLGTELDPFLEALSDSDKNTSRLPPDLLNDLKKITLPAALSLYVSPQCPHCPVTARQIIPLAGASEFVRLSVIDCMLFPEMAQSQKIRSVPTVLLDDQLRWTGPLRLEELVEVMINRDPARLSASSLEAMLKEGDASQVAKMMLETDMIFPSFIDLLVHEKMFIRLGAMVVMEEIGERNRRLAAQVVDPLWERFHQAGDRVQGDIIHVLGESGNNELVPRLRTILTGSFHSEVKEAAQEALEKLTAL